MKISYFPKWHPTEGTVYRQTFRISEEENQKLFNGKYKPGINYGNAYTGSFIASILHDLPEYEKEFNRIVVANSIVIVDKGEC